MSDAFAAASQTLPVPFDRARAERTLLALADGAGAFTPPPRARAVFAAAFGNSPYLARLALREREALRAIVARGPGAVLDESEALARAAEDAGDETAAMACLRRAKRRAALAIALADIAGLWTLEEVTRALTLFADAAVGGSLRFLLQEARRFGFCGARRCDARSRDRACRPRYGQIRRLRTQLFERHRSHRVLRCRTLSFPQARRCARRRGRYRAWAGQAARRNHRRRLRLPRRSAPAPRRRRHADRDLHRSGRGLLRRDGAELGTRRDDQGARLRRRSRAGAQFLKAIEPFIWRRNLDFAAIEDIHSIKRQIHAHVGHGEIAVAGHNIKLGRGGIREIEFFAQTQQLILGGRDPSLRPRGTMAALEALASAGHVRPTPRAN